MRTTSRAIGFIAALAAGALALSACTSGGGTTTDAKTNAAFGAAIDGVVNASTKSGGTLKLLSSSDCDSWDSTITYYGWCWNMQRLTTRSLVGFSKVNGEKPEIVGDLATSLGKHNAAFTEWTYTLKPGLKFSTGKAITPEDVKYGIERNFAQDVLSGGPAGYYISAIQHPKDYAGPYKSGDLDSITTTDDSITFKLTSSFADFDYLMALPAAAPVPAKVEGGTGYTGANYTKKPVSSGPFVITQYTKDKSLTFERNKYWDKATDPFRKPLVNKITLTIDSDPNDIDQRLKAGSYDAKMDTDIGSALQTAILRDAKLKANADAAPTPFVRYLTIQPSVIPNVHCRRAIAYALDKAAILQAVGGPLHGTIPGTMTPPTIPGHDETANPYPTGSDNAGDVAKAKDELQQCGKPTGFSTKYGYRTPSERNPKVFQVVQSSLAKVGIKLTAATYSSAESTKFIGSPKYVKSSGLGVAEFGWGSDFPTGYGFWFSIADSQAIVDPGNYNTPELRNSTVDGVLSQSLTGKATDADFKKLDAAVMDQAVYIPFQWGKTLWYRSSRMTNVTCDNALGFGAYDVVNVGVSDGK